MNSPVETQAPQRPRPPADAPAGDTFTPATHNVRRVLFAIAAVAGLAELAYALLNISAMPVYLRYTMDYNAEAIAGITTAFLLCEGIMKGPFGVLGDRIGRRTLIIGGPLISVFTSLLTLLVHRHQGYLFVLLRVFDGMGAAALWPSALAMIADVVPEERRSQAMSLFNVTYLVGIAVGPFTGGIANDLTRFFLRHAHLRPHLADRLGSTASFYVVSLLFLMTAAVARFGLPNIRPHHEHHHTELEAGFSLHALLISLKQIPETLLMAFVTFFGIGMLIPIFKLFALAEYNVTETQFGLMLLVPALFIAAASVKLGTIGDKIGKARAVRIGIGICAFSMLALTLIHSTIALMIGGSLIGVGFVIAFPAWMALISGACDARQRGAVMGAIGTAQGLGAVLGAPLGGLLYDHADMRIPFIHTLHPSHYVPFIGCTLMLMIAWGLSMAAVKEGRRAC